MALLSANLCLPLVLSAYNDSASDPLTSPGIASPPSDKRDLVESQPISKKTPLEVASNLEADPMPELECRVWGPEPTAEAFAPKVRRLKAMGRMPVVKKAQKPLPSNYLVFLSEFEDASRLQDARKDLTDRNVEHSILRNEGELADISVGVFSRQALAEKQRQRMQKFGYSAAIKEITKQETVYNLTAQVAVESDLYKTSSSGCLAFAHTR